MSSDPSRFVGTIPHHYDHGLGPMIFVDYAADIAERAAAVAPARVLETAAGTGIVTRHLRDALAADAALTATDLNLPMLDIARAKFHPGERVGFQTADATALPFADGAFDAVVCQFGVMFFPDKDRSYAEVFRVLAPGGHYFFNVWDSHRHNAFGRIAHEVVGRFFPDDPPRFQAIPFSYPFDPIKESLTDAGFRDITVAILRLEKAVPDATAFARGLVHGSPLVEEIRTRGGIAADRVVEALAHELRREFGRDPGHMSLQALVFSARKPA